MMLRLILFATLTIIFYPAYAFSAELHFFNTNVLGKSITDSIEPLEKASKNITELIEPKIIQLDTERNVYIASSIFYSSEKIGFTDIVELIDQKYPNNKNTNLSSDKYAAWRVEKHKFVISLSSRVEDGLFRVMYIQFRPTEKVLKTAIKALKSIQNNCADK